MIQGLGPVRQLGYVVRDVERAMAHWAGVLGIGPWFYIEAVPVVDLPNQPVGRTRAWVRWFN